MHTLPPLPYAYTALEPIIDTQTMQIHHTKHHQTYIDKLNAGLTPYPEYQSRSLEDLLTKIKELPDTLQGVVRNHGGGHHNHSLFWTIMRPAQSDNRPTPESALATAIDSQFGSFESFQQQFSDKAVAHFGSGWCWLVKSGDTLEIITTSNQDSPLIDGKTPLLGLDLWEHAYYLHYQNKRADYVSARWSVVNWEGVEKKFKK